MMSLSPEAIFEPVEAFDRLKDACESFGIISLLDELEDSRIFASDNEGEEPMTEDLIYIIIIKFTRITCVLWMLMLLHTTRIT